jgi:hypothetical protein
MIRLKPLLEGAHAPFPAAETEPANVEDQPWHSAYVDAGLVPAMRGLGHRVSGMLMQYLTRTDSDSRFLSDGRAIGGEYAEHSAAASVQLPDAVQAFVYYRTSFTDVLGQVAPPDGLSGARLMTRYDAFMNEVLIGLVSGYDAILREPA